MRYKIVKILFVLCPYLAFSGSGISIFSDGSFQGLADPDGKIIVPAVYDGLGWSDGSVALTGELIGYLVNGKWGLITTGNKKITAPLYHNLEPFGDHVFLASIQAHSSNHLYHGLLDFRGNTLLSFDYFSIETLTPNRLKVSKYSDGGLLYGIRDWEDQEIIPTQYKKIGILENMFVCESKAKLLKLFTHDGHTVYNDWIDKVDLHPIGYKIHVNGQSGLISPDLKVKYSPEYKWIDYDGIPQSLKNWEIVSLTGDQKRSLNGDSVSIINKDLWIAHINDAQHMLGASTKLFANQQHLLKDIRNGFIVTQNKESGYWDLFKTDGTLVDGKFDSISVESNYFFCKNKEGWIIYNAFSRKISEKYFSAVGPSNSRNIPVLKNGYWGWLDFQGNQIISHKFDSIGPGIDKQFCAKYIDNWGVADFLENWIILPEYDRISIFENYYLASKGRSTTILDREGKIIFKTGITVEASDLLRLVEEGQVGVITNQGFVIYPSYRDIRMIDEYYLLINDSSVEMIAANGRTIIKAKDSIENVFSYAEGYFHILKDGKHGFINTDGLLRIANRYDDAQPYSEGLGAIKLMGKWGYVNKMEDLIIQPFYTECSSFEQGLATISLNGNYGIINENGQEVIDATMREVRRTTQGNYLLISKNGKVGLADKKGKVLLSTNYDEIEDTEYEMVIAKKGGKYGVINYSGHSYLPFEYNQIKVQGNYLLLNQ